MRKKILIARRLRSNQTDVEKLLWQHLRNRRLNSVKFRRQHPIGRYIVDFVSLERKLIIELDGGQHNSELGRKRDATRVSWLNKEGFKILRFWNNEVIENLDEVLQVISNTLTLPSPGRRGENGKEIL